MSDKGPSSGHIEGLGCDSHSRALADLRRVPAWGSQTSPWKLATLREGDNHQKNNLYTQRLKWELLEQQEGPCVLEVVVSVAHTASYKDGEHWPTCSRSPTIQSSPAKKTSGSTWHSINQELDNFVWSTNNVINAQMVLGEESERVSHPHTSSIITKTHLYVIMVKFKDGLFTAAKLLWASTWLRTIPTRGN